MSHRILSKTMMVVVAIGAALGALITVMAAMLNLSIAFGKGGYCEAVDAAPVDPSPEHRFGRVHSVMLCMYDPSASLINVKYGAIMLPHAVMFLVCLVVFLAAVLWARRRPAAGFLAVAATVLAVLAFVAGLLSRWLGWQAIARLVAEVGVPTSYEAAFAAGAPWWVVPRTDYDPFVVIDWPLIGLAVVLLVAAAALWRARAAERDVEGLV